MTLARMIHDRAIGAIGVAFFLLLLPMFGQALAATSQPSQRVFASPEEAREALVTAVQSRDRQKLYPVLGPALRDLETGDPVEDATEFNHFAGHVAEGVEVSREGESKAVLRIGANKWPFPIPLVKRANKWIFDTAAGREEILNRRIGHDEFLAINVCETYVEAQKEYYNMPDQDGDQIPKYAQHLFSRPGRRNGLYWPSPIPGKESPLGPLVAKAKEQGYMAGERRHKPFHGYYFKILKKQGKSAPGGKFNYVINGNMVAGHALVAYPSRWGVSGVMTFIVNQSGRVYQKNLGPNTAKIARNMTSYDPDSSWKLVEPISESRGATADQAEKPAGSAGSVDSTGGNAGSESGGEKNSCGDIDSGNTASAGKCE